MRRKLQWKVIAIGVVLVVFGALGVYPLVAARLGVNYPRWLIDRSSRSASISRAAPSSLSASTPATRSVSRRNRRRCRRKRKQRSATTRWRGR